MINIFKLRTTYTLVICKLSSHRCTIVSDIFFRPLWTEHDNHEILTLIASLAAAMAKPYRQFDIHLTIA